LSDGARALARFIVRQRETFEGWVPLRFVSGSGVNAALPGAAAGYFHVTGGTPLRGALFFLRFQRLFVAQHRFIEALQPVQQPAFMQVGNRQ
jgi:hypothetical protein